MKEDSYIQYPSAITDSGKTVDAKNLIRETCRDSHYYCPKCRGVMVPVLGPIRVKHFRHLGAQCKRDDYLHGLAEAAFMEEYQKCLDNGLPFYLEMPVPAWCNKSCVLAEHFQCKERYVRKLIDLTIDFKIITQEARVNTGDKSYRRPDILLQSEDGKQSLWIEFFVTHEVGEEKQKMGRIVEIKISSEKDIDTIIRAHKIVQSDDKEHWVRLYNISTVVLDEPLQAVPPCDKFFLYEGIYSYGSHRIVDKVPKKDGAVQYQIVLRLNWHGKHDNEGYSTTRKTIQSLHDWCENRFKDRFQSMADSQIDTLIEAEYRTEEIKPHAYPRNARQWKPSKTKTNSQNPSQAPSVEHEKILVNWIDLGLPSGVLWADVDGRPEQIDGPCELPDKAYIQELKEYCKQETCDEGLKVIGPNGNAIMLNAAQYRLSSHRYPDSIDMVSIYALVNGDYLHIIEDDDYSAKHKFRCIRRP